MLVPNQKIITTWMPANREHYISKGYVYTKCRDRLEVRAEDLPLKSHERVQVTCDYCGNVFVKVYANFIIEHQGLVEKDCCKECRPKKFAENFNLTYGVNNPFQLNSVKQKSKETCVQRYGTEYACQSEIVKTKQYATNELRYGVAHVLQNEEIKQKAQNTCLERFGVKNVFESQEMQKKIKEICEQRYGEGNIAHTPMISEKIRLSNLEKYGVPYTTQATEVIEKMRQSFYKNGSAPTSKPEKEMCGLLHELFGEAQCKDSYPVGRLNLDCLVYFSDMLIDFEYDGIYWHKNRENYDRRRNYYLLGLGYKIVRIRGNHKDDMPTKEQILQAVDCLVKGNHSIIYIDTNI